MHSPNAELKSFHSESKLSEHLCRRPSTRAGWHGPPADLQRCGSVHKPRGPCLQIGLTTARFGAGLWVLAQLRASEPEVPCLTQESLRPWPRDTVAPGVCPGLRVLQGCTVSNSVPASEPGDRGPPGSPGFP